jgi:hypothetical protein
MIQVAAARKPDGVDFVGNSKISSFPQNPSPTSVLKPIWYYNTLIAVGARHKFLQLASVRIGLDAAIGARRSLKSAHHPPAMNL